MSTVQLYWCYRCARYCADDAHRCNERHNRRTPLLADLSDLELIDELARRFPFDGPAGENGVLVALADAQRDAVRS